MNREEVITWLLEGDISIQYQVHRDLLGSGERTLRKLREGISKEGWGRAFLEKQNEGGYWGISFYNPKWTSTHYTMLDLRNLCIDVAPEIRKALDVIFLSFRTMNMDTSSPRRFALIDLCISGMLLNYASYFDSDEKDLVPLIDYICKKQMPDGGFNCKIDKNGPVHSSVHTTINVLEGIREYINKGYGYRKDELREMEKEAAEFLLKHRLFRSDKTGSIINPRMLRLVYPCRWRYDILRALDYFRYADMPYDERMSDALDIILSKKTKDNRWKTLAHHKGVVHFEMESAGNISRWNTLRAVRILDKYYPD